MLIDIHTHIYPQGMGPRVNVQYAERRGFQQMPAVTAEALLAAMEGVVDMAVVSSCVAYDSRDNGDYTTMNDYVAQQIAPSGGRLLGLCTVNHADTRHALRELRRCVEEKGYVGLKLHPNAQKFFPNDRLLYPVYELMQQYRLPVLFHTGGIGVAPERDRFGHPSYLDDVACDFPEMPIIMGHCGRGFYTDTATLMRKHRNLYADISANFSRLKGKEYAALREMIRTTKIWAGDVDKLLFGSDYPFYQQPPTIDILRRAIAEQSEIPVERADVEKILFANAERLLTGLKIINKQK